VLADVDEAAGRYGASIYQSRTEPAWSRARAHVAENVHADASRSAREIRQRPA
jgi:hypothetical protein